MNMMVVAYGDTAILVDAGVMFPEPDLLGVDLIIPDLRQLSQYRIQALVLTHGHEDHIGAVPHVLSHFDGPIFGTKLTLAFVEPKLEEHGQQARARLTEVKPRDRVTVGCFMLDQTPLDGEHMDFQRFAQLGADGVLVMLGDSTNVERKGVSGSERDVTDGFE